MREPGRHLHRFLGGAIAIAALSAILAGCGGGGGEQFSNESDGSYPVAVVKADFPSRQIVARTYNLVIAVRNTGEESVPSMSVTINLPGEGSTLAFAYRNSQSGLAQAQRPVWVLEEGWPKLAGTAELGGAGTSNRRTFSFGKVKPGQTANMVWRVTAVKPGRHRISYQVAAGLSGAANAKDASGERPEGVLPATISKKAIVTKINDQGKVVPLSQQERLALERQQGDSE